MKHFTKQDKIQYEIVGCIITIETVMEANSVRGPPMYTSYIKKSYGSYCYYISLPI